jgi:hypothetical protein
MYLKKAAVGGFLLFVYVDFCSMFKIALLYIQGRKSEL